MVGPGEVLNLHQRVSSGALCVLRAGVGKIHGHARFGIRVRRPVHAITADDEVVAATSEKDIVPGVALERVVAVFAPQLIGAVRPDDHVVSVAAGQHVVAAVAGKRVVEPGPGEVFDFDECVQPCPERVLYNDDLQRDLDSRDGVLIRCCVVAAAAGEGIVPFAAGEGVVAQPAEKRVQPAKAHEHVVLVISSQDVVVRRAFQALNGNQGVHGPEAIGGRPAEDDGHARRIIPEGSVVAVLAAVKRVVPGAAFEHVVAHVAVELVVASETIEVVSVNIAAERVVKRGADQVLNADKLVLVTRAVQRHAFEVHHDRVGVVPIRSGVNAFTAVKRVNATRALERVVPFAALDLVVSVIPGKDVVELGSREVLDVDQRVQPGVDRVLVRASGQVDRNPARRAFIVRRVGIDVVRGIAVLGKAIQQVVVGSAVQDVFARAAEQAVVAGFAVQVVDPAETVERVGPRAAGQDVPVRVSGERVVEIRADDVLNAGQDVTDQNAFQRVDAAGRVAEIDGDRPGRVRVRRDIIAFASEYRVVPGAALNDVVLRATVQNVVALAAHEEVSPGKAG